MKCLICLRLSVFSRVRASILPGVPTTMCGQLVLRVCWSFLMLIPPKNTETLMLFMYLENLSYSLEIWKANSRVWHITSTLTWPSTCSNCCSVARTNTAVFPMPLLAWQMISMPRIAWGMHSCWTVEKKHGNHHISSNWHHELTIKSAHIASSRKAEILLRYLTCWTHFLRSCMFINAFFCTIWEKVDFFWGLGKLHSTSLAQGGGTLKWNGPREVDKRNLNLHVGAHMPKPSFNVCEFKPWKH